MEKKLIAMLLCLIMVLSLTMTACNNETASTTTQKPSESQTAESTPYVPKDVEVTLVVRNDSGRECPNTTMIIQSKETDETYNVKADDKGVATVILTEGEYTIIFDEVPAFHLAPNAALTVKSGMAAVQLELTNNEPNGTELRPYILNDVNDTKHYAANEMFWFKIRVGEGRSVKIRNANAELVYQGTTYTPDENGEIVFHMQADDPKTQIMFTVTNKSDGEQDIELILEGDPGTYDNPFIVESVDQLCTATIIGTEDVYFRFEAAKAGTLVLRSEDPNNNIYMTNHRNSVQTGKSEGEASITLEVKAGDIVTIVVNVLEEEINGDEISFTLSIE